MLTTTAIVTGLIAGTLHVVSGPDHLAAVAPLAADRRTRAWWTGVMWGVGHSSGTWALALVALAFREAFDVDAVSTWSERLVGAVLVGIGLWGAHRVLTRRLHEPGHHAGHAAGHGHAGHEHATSPARLHTHRHTHGALGVGTLHGLAGTSHLLGVLPALALPTRGDAVAYVVAFGLGSIAAMTLFASAIGLAASRAQRIGARAMRGFMALASLAAMAVGVYWIVVSFAPAAEAAAH